jgi:hypothetical protein
MFGIYCLHTCSKTTNNDCYLYVTSLIDNPFHHFSQVKSKDCKQSQHRIFFPTTNSGTFGSPGNRKTDCSDSDWDRSPRWIRSWPGPWVNLSNQTGLGWRIRSLGTHQISGLSMRKISRLYLFVFIQCSLFLFLGFKFMAYSTMCEVYDMNYTQVKKQWRID